MNNEKNTMNFVMREHIPTYQEVCLAFKSFLDAVSGIKTLNQAYDYWKQQHVTVEIDGIHVKEYLEEINQGKSDGVFEWIRYEHHDSFLWYLYIYFKDGEVERISFDITDKEDGEYTFFDYLIISESNDLSQEEYYSALSLATTQCIFDEEFYTIIGEESLYDGDTLSTLYKNVLFQKNENPKSKKPFLRSESLLSKTSDGKPPRPCSDYEDGRCKSTGDSCDGCYSNSFKLSSLS